MGWANSRVPDLGLGGTEVVSMLALLYLHHQMSSSALLPLGHPMLPWAGCRVISVIMSSRVAHLHSCLQSQLYCAAQSKYRAQLHSAAACKGPGQLSHPPILRLAHLVPLPFGHLFCVAQVKCSGCSYMCSSQGGARYLFAHWQRGLL